MKPFATCLMMTYAALVSYTLLAAAIILPLHHVAPPTPHAEAEPVVLWKSASKSQKAVDLAALTPGCDPHDWGCVVGKAGAR